MCAEAAVQDFAIMEQVLDGGSSSSVDERECGNTDFQVSGDTGICQSPLVCERAPQEGG